MHFIQVKEIKYKLINCIQMSFQQDSNQLIIERMNLLEDWLIVRLQRFLILVIIFRMIDLNIKIKFKSFRVYRIKIK
jgi:hypothetical protein